MFYLTPRNNPASPADGDPELPYQLTLPTAKPVEVFSYTYGYGPDHAHARCTRRCEVEANVAQHGLVVLQRRDQLHRLHRA